MSEWVLIIMLTGSLMRPEASGYAVFSAPVTFKSKAACEAAFDEIYASSPATLLVSMHHVCIERRGA